MLIRDKIISIFCLIDDLFIGIKHQEDSRRKGRDSEVAITAIVSAFYSGGLLTTGSGIPVAFCFTPGNQADVKSLEKIIQRLPPESIVYGDRAYTDYKIEDHFFSKELVSLKIQRKSNSKRKDTKEMIQKKLKMRKRVETTISDIKKMFPRTIHAVTLNGFLIKLILFVFGLQINKSTN